jgi:glycosyltransferase involved in cell wall biosynthesis
MDKDTGSLSPVRRILMSTDCIGGVWTYSLQLAKALASHGIDVVLASMGGPLAAWQQAEALKLRNVTLLQSSYRLEWMVDPWEDLDEAGEWLLALEADFGPDVIHLNGYAHGSMPWRSPVVVVGHSCVYSWHRAVRGCNPPGEWERYRATVERGLRAADAVTAPTRAMLGWLLSIYGPFNAYGPIYNGREGGEFLPGRKEPMIFSAGRLWDEAKNTAALEAAAGRVSWPVYVAGETVHPDGGWCRLENVRHVGQISTEEMARWMGRAAIYALPARYEPFGLTPLEAALAGCALVLGNIPTLREIWADAALYVPPDRADILASVLEALIGHEEIATLSCKARARALRYTPERMARGYVGLYEKVLKNRGKTLLRQGCGGQAAALRRPTRRDEHRMKNPL